MLLEKHNLWLTINSLEHIPNIDSRLLYADVLNSIYNNIYELKQIQIAELNNVYELEYQQLKTLLFSKYLKMIKDTEMQLSNRIIQDICNNYQSQILYAFNVNMYGGDSGDTSTGRSQAVSRRGKKSLLPSLEDTEDHVIPTALPSFPPPPPPLMITPTQELANYNRLKARYMERSTDLSLDELRTMRLYEIKTIPIKYSIVNKPLTIQLSGSLNTKPPSVMNDPEFQSQLSKRRQAVDDSFNSNDDDNNEQESKRKLILSSANASTSTSAPTSSVDFNEFINKIKNNVLLNKTYIKPAVEKLLNDIINYLNDVKLNRASDIKLIHSKKLILDKLIKSNEISEWRYNYEIIKIILNASEISYNIKDFPELQLVNYKQLIAKLHEFNINVLKDNSFNGRCITFF